MNARAGVFSRYEDVWLVDGVRTPFVDYNGALGQVSPIDMGIKVARELFARSRVAPADVGHVFAGSMAQASYDAYLLPRHIGLYSGVPVEVPATLTQRVCGTGIELVLQAGDRIELGQIELGLAVGAESMTRNPIAAYTHRGGFRMGQVEFKDFLWEALLDPAANATMGDTAENLAQRYGITREEVDRFAAESFARAAAAQSSGFLAGEIAPVATETFELAGYRPRGIRIPGKAAPLAVDSHIRSSSAEALAQIRPAFGGVQTGGNSSAIVDGAAAALVASGAYLRARGRAPLARVIAGVAVGVPPEIMGIGPVPAIRELLARTGMTLDAIDRFEVNEAFGAQCLAVVRELAIPRERLNVNGGAIAIGHPLAATGVRLAVTLARELRESGARFGIASACIGGGQGIALLIENDRAAPARRIADANARDAIERSETRRSGLIA
ncbi:MAG: thiolase family protein [Burkholderiales bacterium]|nr:thiolase family protein [Burkholderiales bacterium]